MPALKINNLACHYVIGDAICLSTLSPYVKEPVQPWLARGYGPSKSSAYSGNRQTADDLVSRGQHR